MKNSYFNITIHDTINLESENPKILKRNLHQFVHPNYLVCNITREISINMIYDNQSVIICVYVLIYAYGELCCVLESIKNNSPPWVCT